MNLAELEGNGNVSFIVIDGEEVGYQEQCTLPEDVPGVAYRQTFMKNIDFHYHKETGELLHVLKGEMKITVGGSFRELKAGEEIFIPPGQVHGYGIPANTTVVISYKRDFVPNDTYFL